MGVSNSKERQPSLEVITRHPTLPNGAPPILFVHGAWHGAWCWDVHFLRYFADRGFEAHALSLRGHGGSEGKDHLRSTKISDYVADVKSVVDNLKRRPVLVGHSMGGLVVQKYLEKNEAAGAVLLASVSPSGVLRTTLRIGCRHPLLFTKAFLTRSLYPLIATPKLTRECFFSPALENNKVVSYCRQMQDESFCAFIEMVLCEFPRPEKVRVPVMVMGAEHDTIFTQDEVRQTAEAYRTKPDIINSIAHDMMLEPGWADVAEKIERWVSKACIPKAI